MTTRGRILSGILATVGVALLGLGFALSYEAECGPPPPAAAAGPGSMQAVTYRCYGSPDMLGLARVVKPAAADNEVLVKVHAAGVNPLDWHYLRGEPYLMRLSSGLGKPSDTRLGVDFAGTVEAVGKQVTQFKPGDAVFGGAAGAFGEYVTVREDRAIVAKPANVSFEQAAAVPIAAITALQALRDKGELQAGQKVLINGASGGVGTFAVQIAKILGAEVTGVASTRNQSLMKSLGADRVIDYTQQDFTREEVEYDLIIDNVGSHSLLAYRRVLKPDGIVVLVGSTSKGVWFGPLKQPLTALAINPFVSQRYVNLLADLSPADLNVLRGWLASGKLTALIDRRYTLAEVPAAVTYIESGRARGKVVITIQGRSATALATGVRVDGSR